MAQLQTVLKIGGNEYLLDVPVNQEIVGLLLAALGGARELDDKYSGNSYHTVIGDGVSVSVGFKPAAQVLTQFEFEAVAAKISEEKKSIH